MAETQQRLQALSDEYQKLQQGESLSQGQLYGRSLT
jgi:hypothetical protein